jgi:uncharacterized protein (TIGR03083 family)
MPHATDAGLWSLVHAARRSLADDLSGLDPARWHQPTLCTGWDVEHVVAHLTAAATTGRWRWIRSMLLAGFRPAVHNERRLREHLGPTPAETLTRFEAVVEATVAPTGRPGTHGSGGLLRPAQLHRPQ